MPFSPGVAFPLIRRLLSLYDLVDQSSPIVEVIVLSRNDPETGLRIMRSISHFGLPISRAVFMQGRAPYKFMEPFNMSLFLSADESNIREAISEGFAAGVVIGQPASDSEGNDHRIAFDFDGVLADDTSEQVMQAHGLEEFHRNEVENAHIPMGTGLLAEFLKGINRIQEVEDALAQSDPLYKRRVHVSIVTARNVPAHERVIHTLSSWGVRVNDAFFLGGVDKAPVLRKLRPHVFFDDQRKHLIDAADEIPCVHVPFGNLNSV